MALVKTAGRSVELEPIDRLEEKLKRLVTLVEGMKAEQARSQEDNQRLTRELTELRGRLASSETVFTELTSLKQEREVIRSRVGDMLEQLEALNL